MLKKVSDNIINLLNYFNIREVNSNIFEDFIDKKVPAKISGLVNQQENEGIKINTNLLNSLEEAIDELNDYLVDELDLDDINFRLSSFLGDEREFV